MHKITMLGSGLIGMFYTMSLHQQRGKDQVLHVYSRREDRVREFAAKWGIPRWSTDMAEAINDPETDVVVIGLPNNLHKEAILLAAAAGKAVLCTKPLAMNGQEALEILEAVEKAGVFHGYLEDLAYTPKTLKAVDAVKKGALGQITWTRSREAHPGPHSDWFWDSRQSGGGAIIDVGCHCIEIGRNFMGKHNRPLEVMCWADTLVKPIDAEDNAIGLIKYESGAVAQFEVSWTYRGGMDLRDEVAGTEGTLRIDHFTHTGYEIFTAVGMGDYVGEKVESDKGWMFPVGDEVNALGYNHMFEDILGALDEGRTPMESFYDGYVVNCIMDACYRSSKTRQWEKVHLPVWRGGEKPVEKIGFKEYDEKYLYLKEEKMPDGRKKLILREKSSGVVIEKII
ncbi:MAG: Gfo/Idh/MocA family oxidoreductase [Bacteroidia bacterium]|nr:Gfo/Idh/MocA family oxidoreductase [Bacteroidia bacterium]